MFLKIVSLLILEKEIGQSLNQYLKSIPDRIQSVGTDDSGSLRSVRVTADNNLETVAFLQVHVPDETGGKRYNKNRSKKMLFQASAAIIILAVYKGRLTFWTGRGYSAGQDTDQNI